MTTEPRRQIHAFGAAERIAAVAHALVEAGITRFTFGYQWSLPTDPPPGTPILFHAQATLPDGRTRQAQYGPTADYQLGMLSACATLLRDLAAEGILDPR